MLKDDCSIQGYQPAGYGFLTTSMRFVIDFVLSRMQTCMKRPYGPRLNSPAIRRNSHLAPTTVLVSLLMQAHKTQGQHGGRQDQYVRQMAVRN